MPNDYDSNPIYIDSDMPSGWRELQTLTTHPQGIHACKLNLLLPTPGTQAAGTILVSDPNDATVLFRLDIPATGAFTREIDFDGNFPAWRDFIVTGPTATKVALQIWYRD